MTQIFKKALDYKITFFFFVNELMLCPKPGISLRLIYN